MGSAASVVELDSTTGGAGLSECDIGLAVRQAASPGSLVSPANLGCCGQRGQSPLLEQNGQALRSYVDEGGRNGLEPGRRKLEANEGRREAAVGKTHRRRPHADQRQSREARRDPPGAIWNRQR